MQLEEEDMSATAEPVLLSFKDTTTQEVLVFLFNTEVHVSINHVLKLIRTSHLSRLVHLINDKGDRMGILTELQDLLKNQAV